MRRSIRSLNIPPEGTTGIWTFEDRFVQIPSTRGAKIVFKCSTQGPDLMVHFSRKERLATVTFYSLTKL